MSAQTHSRVAPPQAPRITAINRRQVLLGCGVASTLLYFGMGVAATLMYEGYSYTGLADV